MKKVLIPTDLLFVGAAALTQIATEHAFADPCYYEDCLYEELECVTTPYYQWKDNVGYFISGEFLYWFARENNLSFAVELEAKPVDDLPNANLTFAASSFDYLSSKWSGGYRIGVGTTAFCDGWDFTVTWTSYKNAQSNKAATPVLDNFLPTSYEQQTLLNPWFNAGIAFDPAAPAPFYFDQIAATWKLRFRQIDAELGRQYWLSKKFSVRPFVGVRATWIKTDFETTSSKSFQNSSEAFGGTFIDSYTHKNDGVGIVAGFGPNWFFCPNFSLFANIDASLVWGQCQIEKRENYQFFETQADPQLPIYLTSQSSKGQFNALSSAFDLTIGLRFEESWCSNRFRLLADIGWEHHVWLDYVYRPTVEGSYSIEGDLFFTGFSSYDQVPSDLVIGGLRVRIRLDF